MITLSLPQVLEPPKCAQLLSQAFCLEEHGMKILQQILYFYKHVILMSLLTIEALSYFFSCSSTWPSKPILFVFFLLLLFTSKIRARKKVPLTMKSQFYP